MREKLSKYMKYGEHVDMMYVSNDGEISKRRVKVIGVSDDSFRAYCFLRGSTRVFKVDNVLALVPIIQREEALV